MEDELTQGTPEGQPEQPVQPEAVAEQEYLDFKNRDETWRVRKDLAQQFADEIGWDVNRLKDTIEIGSDGRQLYSRVDEEREQLRRQAEQLQAVREQMQQSRQQYQPPQYPAPTQQGYQPQARPMQRPPAQDVTGTLLWQADMLERLIPVLERIPEIEKNQTYINQSIRQRDESLDTAEERAIAMRAYQETAELWEKEYGMKPPSQRELEAYLRTVTISDDANKSWGQIWDEASWALSGPRVYRQARRNAVLQSQQPNARMVVPQNQAPVMQAPSINRPQNNGDLAQTIRDQEAALRGVTVGDVLGLNSRG